MLPRSPSRFLSGESRLFGAATGLAALLVLLLVAGIALILTHDSLLALRKFGLRFWGTSIWDPVAGEFGALPFLWGTLYSSLLALALSTPVAVGIAVFLSELSPHALKRPLIFLTEMLAAIPSIIYGLWGIFVLVPLVRALQLHIPAWLRATPFFKGPPVGVGLLAASLVLAVMIVPFTASVSREILKAVPFTQREAAYALGATRWEAIRMVLFYGRTGIIGAVILGLGRALGETMAVTMVIGNNPQVSLSLFAPQHTLAAVIALEFTEAADDLYLHALVEIGLVLFIVTIVINALSRLLIWKVGGKGPEAAAPLPVTPKA